jgi:hypothetical protein
LEADVKVIVKYYGSLDGVRAIADDVKVSELLAQYAVVDIDAAYLDELRNVPEVIYIEEPSLSNGRNNKDICHGKK